MHSIQMADGNQQGLSDLDNMRIHLQREKIEADVVV